MESQGDPTSRSLEALPEQGPGRTEKSSPFGVVYPCVRDMCHGMLVDGGQKTTFALYHVGPGDEPRLGGSV